MTIDEQIKYLMEQADDDLIVCGKLGGEHPNAAVSRAYYAMFHAAEAVLLTRELKFKKHSAVIGAFNKEFVKNGVFLKKMSKQLKDGFDYRTQGDYGPEPILPEAARAVTEAAVEFVGAIRDFLKERGHLKENTQ